MKALKPLCILVLATAAVAASAQQDDGIEAEDLFSEDFEPNAPKATINDPLQGLNRVIFTFNDAVYDAAIRPFSKAYAKVMPDPVEKGVSNFFENIKFPSRFVSNVLQGRLKQAGRETGKFLVDSTVGLAGFLRPSKDMPELQTSDEDLGQTFGRWGIGHGFYLVMPFMGPTSLRDFVADFGDDAVEPLPKPWTMVDDDHTRNSLRIFELVNNLPDIMELYDSMSRSAIDPYTAMRDAYAQRRARQVAE